MKEFFATYPYAAWSIVSILLAAVVIATLWEKVKWWWMNTWYAFPVIGATARLARDSNRAGDNGWFKSELTLCRDYKKFIRIRDEHDFNEKITYLTKAGDLGRRGTPFLIWVLTCALVFIEAMGFSYVLAGYTIPGASENLQQMGAVGIAFMISVLLVAFTHFSGHELYVSSKIAAARRGWKDNQRSHDFQSGDIALARSQNLDDDTPHYTQLANRVGAHAKYIVTIGTAVFILFVAIGATYVRGQVLEKMLHQQVVGEQSTLAQPAANSGLDMSSNALPPDDVKSNNDANTRAQQDEENIDRHGGWGTFIVLAFIFVFLQLLGVLFGFKWGFAGRESDLAFKAIGRGRYSSYADVRAHYSEIADAAQARLEGLQQRMMDRNGSSGTRGVHTSKTFTDFMHMERASDLRDRESERDHTRSSHDMATARKIAPAVVVEAAPIAQVTPAVPVAEPVLTPVAAAVTADADDELIRLRQQLAEREQAKVAQDERQAEISRLKAQLAELDGDAKP
ncbi:hypothetical protein [Silvimonas soli]|uniref:hypothetical protein n=1 Tax=Silvimonas soli TaxID=2980100 RepID=UPI0024B3994F|nr:hypothetical protein [Silvimonas soli]